MRNALIALLTETDGMSVAEMCKELGGTPNAMRQRLSRMAAEGDLHSRLVPAENSPFIARYSIGPDEKGGAKECSQRIVNKWKSECRRDPLVAALFGQAQQQGS